MKCGVKLRRNDQVEVIAGKDKGKVGKIFRVYADGKIVVERINMIKRHTKPNIANQQGGIIEKEAPINISNVMLICPKCSSAVRIGKKFLADGTAGRVCKKCGDTVDRKA